MIANCKLKAIAGLSYSVCSIVSSRAIVPMPRCKTNDSINRTVVAPGQIFCGFFFDSCDGIITSPVQALG